MFKCFETADRCRGLLSIRSYHSSTCVLLQVDCNKGVTGTVYEYGANTIDGGGFVNFQQYAGKHILFVNVAPFCGLTATYPGKNSNFNSLSALACHITIL